MERVFSGAFAKKAGEANRFQAPLKENLELYIVPTVVAEQLEDDDFATGK